MRAWEAVGRRARLRATFPIAVVGLLFQLGVPLVLVLDLVYGLFFVALWRRYRPPSMPRPNAAPSV